MNRVFFFFLFFVPLWWWKWMQRVAVRRVIKMSRAWIWMTVGAYNNDIGLIVFHFAVHKEDTLCHCLWTIFSLNGETTWMPNLTWITFSQWRKKKNNEAKRKTRKQNHYYRITFYATIVLNTTFKSVKFKSCILTSICEKKKKTHAQEKIIEKNFYWIVGLSRSHCWSSHRDTGGAFETSSTKINRRFRVSVEICTKYLILEHIIQPSNSIDLNASKLTNGFIMLKDKTKQKKKKSRLR